MSKLLVTTALERTWRESDEMLFLGEWCKVYDRKQKWEKIGHSVAPFHWDDREKLKRDYDYLKLIHKRLLVALTDTLNNYHKVNYSLRYWQILLDPWLMSYVSVLFDHWECIRTLFEDENNNELETILPNSIVHTKPPYSYSEFINDITLSDAWHYRTFARIIQAYFYDKCLIIKKNIPLANDGCVFSNKNSFLISVISYVDSFISKLSKKYNVIQVKDNDLGFMNNVHESHRIIYDKTLSYYFLEEGSFLSKVSDVMQDMIKRGNQYSNIDYTDQLNKQVELTSRMNNMMKKYDIDYIITPSTGSSAPEIGKQEVDDSALIWTYFGMPSVSIPIFKNKELALPFGLQIVSSKYNDLLLLDFSRKLYSLLK